MLKISAVSQGSIVLHRALRTLSSLRRSQHEIKSCSFWIHTNNSALNLSQQLFTHTAVKVCFTPPCFPRPWKTSWSPQTTSHQAGNHYHWSSFLDLRSKVLYMVTQENGVFSSNSAAFGSRSIKWSPWLFFPSELLWGNSLARITWEWPSLKCMKLYVFSQLTPRMKRGTKPRLKVAHMLGVTCIGTRSMGNSTSLHGNFNMAARAVRTPAKAPGHNKWVLSKNKHVL